MSTTLNLRHRCRGPQRGRPKGVAEEHQLSLRLLAPRLTTGVAAVHRSKQARAHGTRERRGSPPPRPDACAPDREERRRVSRRAGSSTAVKPWYFRWFAVDENLASCSSANEHSSLTASSASRSAGGDARAVRVSMRSAGVSMRLHRRSASRWSRWRRRRRRSRRRRRRSSSSSRPPASSVSRALLLELLELLERNGVQPYLTSDSIAARLGSVRAGAEEASSSSISSSISS